MFRNWFFVAVMALAFTSYERVESQSATANHVVISEVQVGGTDVNDEFVELYNPTNSAISLSGWRLTKKTNSGSESTLVSDFGAGVSIAARGFFLVAPPVDYDGPAADKTYTNTSNRLATNNTVLLYSDAQVTLVDKVAWGSATGLDPEGTATANPANNGSIERKASCSSTAASLGTGGNEENSGNSHDTGNNSTDFVQQTISNPQNAGSSAENDPPIATVTADAGNDQEVCAGNSVQIGGAPTATGGIGPYTFSWSPGDGLDDASTANPMATPAGTTVYTVEVTDASGCADTDEITVTVTAAPSVSFNPPGPFCENDAPVDLSGFASPTGGTFSGDGITGSVFDPGSAGAGAHTITYTLSGTCGGSESRNIMVHALPNVTFAPVGPFLVSDSPLDLSSAVAPGGGTFSGPGMNGNLLDPAAAGAGTHHVTYSFTDANGCSNSASREIVVNGGSSSSPDLVFIADHFVNLDRPSVSEGAIHSNGNIQFKKGRSAAYAGDLTAVDDIIIHARNTVNGNVSAGDEVTIENGAAVNGAVTENAAVAVMALPNPSFSAGGSNHTIPASGTLALLPGTYGNVIVGKGATLELSNDGTSGDYFCTTLELHSSAVLSIDIFSGPVAIHVVNKLNFDKKTEVMIASGTSGSAEVTFITLQESRLIIGPGASVLGTIIAADAAVRLSKNSRFQGLLIAKEIVVQQNNFFQPHGSPAPLLKIVQDVDEVTEVKSEAVESEPPIVDSYALAQNYPNPFNPTTVISFQLPVAREVSLSIYNLNGQLVKQLANGEFASGRHQLVWDATDHRGERVASGVYLYLIKAGSFTQQRKLLLMK